MTSIPHWYHDANGVLRFQHSDLLERMAKEAAEEYKPLILPITDVQPFKDEEGYLDYADYCMVGFCPKHNRMEAVTSSRVGGGSDPTQVYYFQCGTADPASF